MNKEKEKHSFEIGQWVHTLDGIGQVLFIRENYVEKYSMEYFEGAKVGERLEDSLVCKILCDFDGKLRKRNRISAYTASLCEPIDEESKTIIESIKAQSPDEYRKYLIYDDKEEICRLVQIFFKVPPEAIEGLKKEIKAIWRNLPSSFTFKEFLAMAKEKKFSLDFSQGQKYVADLMQNFVIVFYNPLYKTINKQCIFTSVRGMGLGIRSENVSGKGVHAHHVEPVKDAPEKASDPRNIQFMPKDEHIELHRREHRRDNE